MVGLGVMGRNLLLNMADHGFSVAGYDKDPTKVDALRQEAENREILGASDIKEFIGYRNIRNVYVDPAAASLKLELRQNDLPVVDALNDVVLGIKIVHKFISGKNLVIQKGCTTLIEHLQSYAWDSKASDRGEDKPLKQNDHLPDALRYCIASAFPYGELNNPSEGRSIDDIRRDIYGNDNPFGFNPGSGGGGYY